MTRFRVLTSRADHEDKVRSDGDLGGDEGRVLALYRDNVETLNSDHYWRQLIGQSPDYETLRDLFLWGMIGTCIAGRPLLPTDPCDGLSPFFVRSLVHLEGLRVPDARDRADLVGAAVEAGHPILDGFVEAGGLAMMTRRTDCLLLAHERLPSDVLRGEAA